MKYYNLLIIAFIFSLIIGLNSFWCSEAFDPYLHYNKFYCHNETSDTLRTYCAFGVSNNYFSKSYTVYPDTLLPAYLDDKEVFWGDYQLKWVLPNKSGELYLVKENLDVFMHTVLPKDTLSVFFLSNDTLRKYGYIDVRENNRYLVRYDLSSSEVKQLDYTFPYPPTPEMSDMKMWPCYRDVIEKVNEQP